MEKNRWAGAALLALLAGGSAHADFCDRTPEIVAAVEDYLGIPCQKIRSDDLRRVKNMYMRIKGVTALQEGDFAGMTGVEYLGFHGNLLIGLPGRVFRNLESVLELDLSHNQIDSLPEGLLKGMPYLETLNLYENRLTTLPVGFFDGMVRLKALTLASNQLTAIPAGLFSGLKGLEYLEVSGNLLTPQDKDQIRSEIPRGCVIYF